MEVKSRFLRVGGSAWEFKIDTERLQDKENNDLEEGDEIIKVSNYINMAR